MFTQKALASMTLALIAMTQQSQAVTVPGYAKLTELTDAVGIDELPDAFTLFAPADATLEKLISDVPAVAFSYNTDVLTQVLKDHLLGSLVASGDLPATATTLGGNPLDYSAEGVKSGTDTLAELVAGKIDQEVKEADVLKGYIHEVNKVILVPSVVPATTIAELATKAGLTTLVAAITENSPDVTGAATAAANADTAYTVFAPTNAAFEKLFADYPILNVDSDIKKEAVDAVLKHHIVSGDGVILSSALAAGDNPVTTLLTTTYNVNVAGDKVTVAGANVVAADARAWGAVAHVIDQVLIPEAAVPYVKTVVDVATENDLTTLAALLGAGELVDALKSTGELTVFAPSNDAFTALGEIAAAVQKPHNKDVLQSILKYHVVGSTTLTESNDALNGQKLTVKDGKVSTVSGQDVTLGTAIANGDKGIQQYNVYPVDTVLLPDGVPATSLAELATTEGLTSLVAALTQAELAGSFTSPAGEVYTVFAPTNEAFAKFLGDSKLEDVKKEDLAEVLKYHVVKGAVKSTDLKSQEYETLSGKKIKIDVEKLMVNDAKLNADAIDLRAFNGYAHVIDAVLTPAAEDNDEDNNGASGASTVSVAVGSLVAAVFAALRM